MDGTGRGSGFVTDGEAVLVPAGHLGGVAGGRRQRSATGRWRRRAPWPRMLAALALATYGWWICSVAFFPFPLAPRPLWSGPEGWGCTA